MAWGQRGLDQAWLRRLEANDPTFTSLTILSSRRLQPADWLRLSQSLTGNRVLRELSCSGHSFGNDLGAIDALCDAIAKHPALEHLAVGDRSFGSDVNVFDRLVTKLSTNNRVLKKLLLDGKSISAEAASALANAIVSQQQALGGEGLHTLDLSSNSALTDSGIQNLSDAFLESSGPVSLRKLGLAGCDLSANSGAHIAKWLGNSNLCLLEELDISDNPLGADGVLAIFQSLQSNRSLRVVNVAGTVSIPDDSFELWTALSDALKIHPSIHTLTLNSNPTISAASMNALAAGLFESKSLRILRMANCAIEDAGIARLVGNPPADDTWSLDFLDLSRNKITGSGFVDCVHFASSRIKRVDLSCNVLSDTFASAVSSVQEGWATPGAALEYLALSGSSIRHDAFNAFVDHLVNRAPQCFSGLKAFEIGDTRDGEETEAFAKQVDTLAQHRPNLDILWRTSQFTSENNGMNGMPSMN
ncbi:RNI-like protein [Ramicandelaber brevisporus]|nr:RNI-like protein [Ramicandelaber brevisporus]